MGRRFTVPPSIAFPSPPLPIPFLHLLNYFHVQAPESLPPNASVKLPDSLGAAAPYSAGRSATDGKPGWPEPIRSWDRVAPRPSLPIQTQRLSLPGRCRSPRLCPRARSLGCRVQVIHPTRGALRRHARPGRAQFRVGSADGTVARELESPRSPDGRASCREG